MDLPLYAFSRIALCSPYSTGYDEEQKDMTSACPCLWVFITAEGLQL
ncbi:hypothetical protein J2T20_004315 [Paenibacillus wynnii]|nr:hypothetical protein [Paenibacillus wynnii]